MISHKSWLWFSCIICILLFRPGTPLFPQEVPHPVNNTGIYEFLDELAGLQVIEVLSSVKPWSRLYIANLLKEADSKRDLLNSRQQKELDFYLLDFGKELNTGKNWKRRLDLFYYSDSLFSVTLNPVLGGEIFTNSSGKATYLRNGVEARAYIQKWGFYASLRDNHEKPLLGRPAYLTKREGGHIKNGTDWSEMQGGVTWSWKWGNAGLVKDRLQWGDNYNGANIFSGTNPTFVQLRLNLKPVKWFSFNYYHGWLNSMVVDSSRSYWINNSYGAKYRSVYHKKYVAANMFSFIPLKHLSVSLGNSIIYTDKHFNPAYIVPIFFYKSVDHSQTSGVDNMNSQMFLDISSRNIRNLHLYVSLFVDELSVSRFTKNDEWNFLSWKTGFSLSNFPVENLSFTTEFTYSYPLTYQHYVTTLTFEQTNYNLGHYLKDNSREWYLALNYRPYRAFDINLFFLDAVRGPDYSETGGSRVGNPPLESVEWHNVSYGIKALFQIKNDLYAWLDITKSKITGDDRWSPEFLFGNKTTVNLGITFGF